MLDFVEARLAAGDAVEIVAFEVDPGLVSKGASIVQVPRVAGPFVVQFLWYWLWTSRRFRETSDALVVACGAISAAPVDVVWMHFWHAEHLRKTGWFTVYAGDPLRFASQTVARLVAFVAEHQILRRRSPALFAVSDSLAEALRGRYPDRPVYVVPNPVKTIGRGSRSPGRHEPVRLLFIGGEWGRKGLPFLLKTIRQLPHESRPEVQVLGRGSASYVKRWRTRVPLRHTPWADDVVPFVLDADAMVVLSRYETFAMAGFEALALGLPVITTDVHGISEAVAITRLGEVIERSPGALLTAIESLRTRPADRPTVSSAQAWVRDHFNVSKVHDAQAKAVEAVEKRKMGGV